MRGVRGAFRKTTFHFFLIDALVDSRTSRSALIRSSNTFTGSSFGSCGTSSPRNAFQSGFVNRGLADDMAKRLSGLLVLGLFISLLIVNVDFVVHCQIVPREIR